MCAALVSFVFVGPRGFLLLSGDVRQPSLFVGAHHPVALLSDDKHNDSQ